MINTRVELDRELDNELRKLAKTEERSKRHMARLLIKRVVRAWKSQPDAVRALGILGTQSEAA